MTDRLDPARRSLLAAVLLSVTTPALAAARAPAAGERLARAARAQVGVTTHYDGHYRQLAYPNGDLPRDTGVCADVVVRAYRDALAVDLQRLVHEDMLAHFSLYPQSIGQKAPNASIDHRRVRDLEIFFRRQGAELWRAKGYVPGWRFPHPLLPGDLLTWKLFARGTHIAVVVEGGPHPRIVQNIAWGAREEPLTVMWPHEARSHYRWLPA